MNEHDGLPYVPKMWTSNSTADPIDVLLREVEQYRKHRWHLHLAIRHDELGEPLTPGFASIPMWVLLERGENDGA